MYGKDTWSLKEAEQANEEGWFCSGSAQSDKNTLEDEIYLQTDWNPYLGYLPPSPNSWRDRLQ